MSTDYPVQHVGQPELFPDAPAPANPAVITEAPALNPGRIVATRGALAYMLRHGVHAGALLGRHVFGDPGELTADDIAANSRALQAGLRVLSVYAYGADRERIWLITEADRSVTTLLLPDEY